MSWGQHDIYNHPEEFGTEIVGTVDLDEPSYSFNYALVSRNLTSGRFYVNTDSGCSCPSPFEDFTTKTSLGMSLSAQEAATRVQQLVDEANTRDDWSKFKADASAVISKIMSY